ncbi:hypothetical protein LCGC14_1228860 [marine sediment metagenome]|uniref:Uncharacterized protein n=1 Tax=marine sediment metagenome TaxID=412755 RepID=A0A0F9L921_9ZZZZ
MSSNAKLEKIKTLLKKKAEESVEVRILVPSVKVNFYSKDMKKELEELEKEKILHLLILLIINISKLREIH